MISINDKTEFLESLRDEFCNECGAFVAEAGGRPYIETDKDGKELHGMTACGLIDDYMH